MYVTVLHPFRFLISGREWDQVDLIGISPDATALATLGVALFLYPRGLILMVLPALWLTISGLSLAVFNQPEGWVSIIMVTGILTTIIARFFSKPIQTDQKHPKPNSKPGALSNAGIAWSPYSNFS